MTTSFSSLPIIDLADLRLNDKPSAGVANKLSEKLYDAFATTGFAYLINPPLTFDHEDIFRLGRSFFGLPIDEKMRLAKQIFQPNNVNTYRGYFPVQPLIASDNLKEGFEIGPVNQLIAAQARISPHRKVDLAEANVWPTEDLFDGRPQLEKLYTELQQLSSQLLRLLAMSLGMAPDFFADYLKDSLSTLRLLHYPLVNKELNQASGSSTSLSSIPSVQSTDSLGSNTNHEDAPVKLSCTPHTDSGILTLLHQDPTGGLEVRNSLGHWVPAPYVPGSIVVNIGDLMAEVSGGRFVATMHRVRAPMSQEYSSSTLRHVDKTSSEFGRFSVPFFFEPGEECVVKSVDDEGTDHGILYGEHVRAKMKTWVEFQGQNDGEGEEVHVLQ